MHRTLNANQQRIYNNICNYLDKYPNAPNPTSTDLASLLHLSRQGCHLYVQRLASYGYLVQDQPEGVRLPGGATNEAKASRIIETYLRRLHSRLGVPKHVVHLAAELVDHGWTEGYARDTVKLMLSDGRLRTAHKGKQWVQLPDIS